MTPKKNTANILWFSDINKKDVELVGGKNASLGEMYSSLTKKGIRIPNGFAVTANAYWYFLRTAELDKKMKKLLNALDPEDLKQLTKVGKQVRSMILKAHFPQNLEQEIITAYKKLSSESKQKNLSVAVRSSATAEDLPDASFAGQQESFLNIKGEKEVLLAVKHCIASLFTNRAISYRHAQGFGHMNVALSVTIQKMVGSDTASAGVMFTLDTESGFQGATLIDSSYGLGEYVVKGRVTPDQFYIFKEGIKQGKNAIISKKLGTKEVKLVYGIKKGTKQIKVKQKERDAYSITDKEIVQLAKWGMIIEDHYKRPQDIEWAKDGKTGDLYIVQARPETVKTTSDKAVIEKYQLNKEGKIMLRGLAVGQKIGAGKVRVIENPKDMKLFKKGEILVTRITDPDWEPIMRIASAIVTEQGGQTSHAAIVSRELGVPAVVSARGARKILKNGKGITVSCAKGDDGIIYNGILPFEVKRTILKNIPKTKTKIMMNVGDPEHAFDLSFLPNDGIGLARLEFIFNEFVRIHPLALVNFHKLKDKKAKKQILEITHGYKDKKEFCVDKLAQGIGKLATSVYPKPVIVRMSDFKSNEYAKLIGGKQFEPKEENPMLGWRGASRYYSDDYKDAFKLECQALKKVRNEWGLTNVIAEIPVCRTPEEGKKVIEVMSNYGLKQGENGLQIYVMCEIPSNVILAEEFAKIFDGFSIGSNDLTQFTLGVDRDSQLVSHIFDANDKAVKKLISNVIKVAHKYKKEIGICGQAPSDSPEFADFLVREKIDSISLNPDTVVETRQRIAKLEKTLGKTGKKTNKKYLSLIAVFGIMSASLIGLGAGCAEQVQNIPTVITEEISPAQIREQVTKKINQQVIELRQELKNKTTKSEQVSLAEIKFDYPSNWTARNWDGGITVKNEETGEYISIFKQINKHPVSKDKKTSLIVGNNVATKYTIPHPGNSKPLHIIEVKINDEIVEINGQTDIFDEIIASITFGQDLDKKEATLCAQVITYAKPSKSAECQAFPTPCEVPDTWQACGLDDAR